MRKEILVTLVSIVLFAYLGLYSLTSPIAASVNAPLTQFSAGRAMQDLEVIAQTPHPIGSSEHANVRHYILNKLDTLGLEPVVQAATVVNPRGVNSRGNAPIPAGTIHNVIARLQGTDNTKAIVLIAHYDSVINSPGASDDGAAVVALLETLRALTTSAPLRNDVIFLFSDGEEVGLLGAKAFVDDHPWAKDVGVVLNFEARGSYGPSIMFETSNHNDWLIQEFAKAALHPVANSLTSSIYNHLPNDTDLTLFKTAGLPGLNFAYINGLIHYHTQSDSLENLSQQSLQHHGEYALALARHLGALDLLHVNSLQKTNAVYFNLPGSSLIHYSDRWVIPLTSIVTVLFFTVLRIGFKQKQLTWRGITSGTLFFLVSLVITIVVVTLTWWIIFILHNSYRSIPQGDTYNSNLYLLAFIALTAAITSALYGYCSETVGVYNLTIGAMLWWVLFMLLTSVALPGASYVFTWPLFFSLVGLGFLFIAQRSTIGLEKRFAALSVASLPGIILLTPTLYLMFVALTLSLSAAIMALTIALLGLLIPLLFPLFVSHKRLLPAISLLASVMFILAGSLTSGFDADHPKPNSIFYGFNANTGEAIWASADETPDEWTSQFLSDNPEPSTLSDYLPNVSRTFLTHQAPIAPLSPPRVETISHTVNQDVRTVRLRITSPRQARIMRLSIPAGTDVIEAAINGTVIDRNGIPDKTASAPNQPNKPWSLNYFALPTQGIELTLAVKPSQPFILRAVDQSDGLPNLPNRSFLARPDYMMATAFGYGVSDSTLVSKSYVLAN